MKFRLLVVMCLGAACLPLQAGSLSGAGPTARVQAPASLLTGAYTVDGRNADGSAYRGTAIVQSRSDGKLQFVWHVGAFQRGIGTLDGNVVTVDFGDAFPAIYELQSDGSLSGTWANGLASERLTPIGAQRT